MAADHFTAPFAHLDLPGAPNIHTKKKYAKQMKVSAGAYLADLAAGKSGHDVSTILEASTSSSPMSLKNLKVSCFIELKLPKLIFKKSQNRLLGICAWISKTKLLSTPLPTPFLDAPSAASSTS